MEVEKAAWCIAITLADPESKVFVTLGGAGWELPTSSAVTVEALLGNVA